MMDSYFNYFRDVNKYMGTLYSMTKKWYAGKMRTDDKRLKEMFQRFLKIEDQLLQIKKIIESEAK